MYSLFEILPFKNKEDIQHLNGEELSSSINVHKFSILDIEKKEIQLAQYQGKVLLIVNVASKCGFTKQYDGLQKIYERYRDQGFQVLGFPCNDFGGQEPGSNEEIAEFCSQNYNVTFPIFNKIKVKGDNKEPLYNLLTNNPITGRSSIMWNFEKFLIDRNGNVVKRFKSYTKPKSKKITSAIEELIKN